MNRKHSSALTALGLAAILGGAGCATVATHDDYAAYRELRSKRDDERLVALGHYATQFPNGVWAAEIQRERSERENDIWGARNSTREGLELYLAAYPDGRYVEQARQRLAAVSAVQERRGGEAQRVEQVQQAQREQTVEARRRWVTTASQFWARTLLGIRNYGSSIAQVARQNPEFSQAFGQQPEPLCTPQSCIKHYHGAYAIPVPGGTRLEREMHMFLRIVLTSGRVDRVEVLMPQKGFSRWYELENRTLVTDEDPQQRQAAIAWALERLEPTMREAFTGANPIDIVPDPIAPISAQAQAQSAGTQESTAAPTTTPEASASAATPSGEQSAVDS
jgi:hypothetical protein